MKKAVFFAAAAFFFSSCSVRSPLTSQDTLVFLTDFGTKDSAVAVCKGVMLQIHPALNIIDLTHEAPPYDAEAAARILEETVPFYPEGTVFVAVVDPGVGSARRAIAVRTKTGHILAGPDNGLFTRILDLEGLDQAVETTNPQYFRQGRMSSTFHGRDVFSPVGAHLAKGVPLESMGPPVRDLKVLKSPLARLENGAIYGSVSYLEDPFGNVVTDIPRHLVEQAGFKLGNYLDVLIGKQSLRLPFLNTFSDAPEGSELALFHSRGVLSFSVNQGNFSQRHQVDRGQPVRVRLFR